MVNFLHISDLHILNKQGELRKGIDPCKKLEKLICLTRDLELNPSFSIISGDLSHGGTVQSYELVKKYISELESLGGPVIPAVGTRDNRDNFRRILLGKPSPQKDAPCYYSRSLEGFHIVILDSQTHDWDTGAFNGSQLDWLEKELQNHPDEPAIISFHNPIYFFGELGNFNRAHARAPLDFMRDYVDLTMIIPSSGSSSRILQV